MRGMVRTFLQDESAAPTIEYGIIAAGIAVAIIAVLKGLGSKYHLHVGPDRSQMTDVVENHRLVSCAL